MSLNTLHVSSDWQVAMPAFKNLAWLHSKLKSPLFFNIQTCLCGNSTFVQSSKVKISGCAWNQSVAAKHKGREQKSRSAPWEAAAAAVAAAAALTQTASVFGREAAGAECSGNGVCSRIYMASFVQLQSLPRVSHWISVFLWPKRGLHKVEARHWHK